ncbi:MAG: AAA family ATPase [Thiobacillus sp.]|nr:AAA family ATPase [Thiobacillus sp.]
MPTVEAVASALRHSACSAKHVVGVDGFMGSGKTKLAFELAESLGGIRISLDTYIDRDADAQDYPSKIMRDYLASDLQKLKGAFQFVVIEGICLLEVLAPISWVPDSLVYVKRISTAGLWHDGFHLEDFETNQSTVENQEGLHRSEFEYHSKWRPHERATVVYERVEDGAS